MYKYGWFRRRHLQKNITQTEADDTLGGVTYHLGTFYQIERLRIECLTIQKTIRKIPFSLRTTNDRYSRTSPQASTPAWPTNDRDNNNVARLVSCTPVVRRNRIEHEAYCEPISGDWSRLIAHSDTAVSEIFRFRKFQNSSGGTTTQEVRTRQMRTESHESTTPTSSNVQHLNRSGGAKQ